MSDRALGRAPGRFVLLAILLTTLPVAPAIAGRSYTTHDREQAWATGGLNLGGWGKAWFSRVTTRSRDLKGSLPAPVVSRTFEGCVEIDNADNAGHVSIVDFGCVSVEQPGNKVDPTLQSSMITLVVPSSLFAGGTLEAHVLLGAGKNKVKVAPPTVGVDPSTSTVVVDANLTLGDNLAPAAGTITSTSTSLGGEMKTNGGRGDGSGNFWRWHDITVCKGDCSAT